MRPLQRTSRTMSRFIFSAECVVWRNVNEMCFGWCFCSWVCGFTGCDIARKVEIACHLCLSPRLSSDRCFPSSLLCKLELSCCKGSLLPSWLYWASGRQKRGEIQAHIFSSSPFVPDFLLWLSSIPNVNTMKMMTATPSRIARQLRSMERRPYFLAPSTSPVWRTDLD